MAIESQPPVLRRVQPPSELEMVEILKSMQENFIQNKIPKHFNNEKIFEDVAYKIDSLKTITSDIFDFLVSTKSNQIRKTRSDIGTKRKVKEEKPQQKPENFVIANSEDVFEKVLNKIKENKEPVKKEIPNVKIEEKQPIIKNLIQTPKDNSLDVLNKFESKQKVEPENKTEDQSEKLKEKLNSFKKEPKKDKESKQVKKDSGEPKKQNELFEKFIDKIESLVSTIKNNFGKGASSIFNSLITGVLGPLNLMINPLMETFGVNFSDIFNIFKKDKKTKPKKEKQTKVRTNPKKEIVEKEIVEKTVEPDIVEEKKEEPIINLSQKEEPKGELVKLEKVKINDSDVKNKRGEIYWLWKKIFGKKESSDGEGGGIDGSFLGKIFGGMSFAGIGAKILKILKPELFAKISGGLKNLFTFIFKGNLFENIGNLLAKKFPSLIGKKFISVFSKAGPITMIVGGLVMAVKDGIKGLTQGWKTSKVSNFAGSFLGGVDKGIKGAFKNMGKWALIGAGVGSFIPVVGTVLGGVLGAVVGGILGFIGGENIAKAFNVVGAFVNKWIIQPIVTFFKFIGGKINEYVIQPVAGFFKMIGNFVYEKVIEPVVAFVSPIIEKVVGAFKWFGRWFYKFFMLKEIGEVFSKMFKKFKGIPSWIKDNILSPIGKFFKNAIGGISSGLKWISDKVLAPIGEFFQKAWDALGDSLVWVKDNVLLPIADFFKKIFNKAFDGLVWIKENILAPIGTFFGNLFTTIAESEVGQFFKEKVINPIKGFFSYIGNLFGFIFSGEVNILDIIMGVTKDGREELAQSLDNYVKAKQVMDTDDYKKFDTEMQSKDKKWNSKSVSEKHEVYKNARNVNDAIITPKGRVIIPSSNDTIIATKSPVEKFSKNSEISQDLKLFQNDQSKKDNSIVEAINKLIKTVEKKPFNNVFANSTYESTNFDKLRVAY